MPDAWPDADSGYGDPEDEQALLMTTLNGPDDHTRRTRRPIPRKRVPAITVLILLLIPFVFLLWMTSWTRQPTDHDRAALFESDAFALNPKFDSKAAPRTRIYNWTVSAVPVPGANRTRMVVNGRSPGPLIEANADDRILVYVTNGLVTEGTSIHWHALPQPHTPFYDGAPGISQCPIPPSATLLYNFTFGGWTGTTWWHGHYAMQHTDGLFGPLIVHASSARTNSPDYAAEHVLTLSDVYGTEAGGLLDTYRAVHPMETVPEPVPDRATINGRGAGPHADADADVQTRAYGGGSGLTSSTRGPRQETHNEDDNPGYPTGGGGGAEEGYAEVEAKAWTTTRLRLINAGTFAPLRVSVDNHALTIIEADGTPVAPVRVRDLVVHPAQRYSVLVTRDEGDATVEAFWIRARMVEDKFAYINPQMQPEARAILRYTSASVLKPLPTTHPGPPPNNKLNAWWYELPSFDEWKLRPAASSSSASKDAAALENTNTGVFRNTTNVLSIPFIFSIQRTHELYWRSFINGTSWEVPLSGEAALVADTAGVYSRPADVAVGTKVWPGDQLIATIPHEQTVDFIITNLDDGDHPFHLHGYAPWLLGVGPGRYKPARANLNMNDPLRRDTFLVPSRGWAVVRIVADNAGYWAFHCHITWHMMGGGLFQVAVAPTDGPTAALPADIVQQCKIWGV